MNEWVQIITALCTLVAVIGSTIVSTYVAIKQAHAKADLEREIRSSKVEIKSDIEAVHKTFNSKMDEHLALVARASKAEGIIEGKGDSAEKLLSPGRGSH